jgi:aminoglycoside phosphotransferase (APT) family kinase protein
MIDTLALLHSIDPDSIGLGTFGKRSDFYRRHCQTFSRIEAQQALVKDKDTGKPLGRAHEKYDEIVDFIRRNAPGERNTIVHGDYKFDNVVSMTSEKTKYTSANIIDSPSNRTPCDCCSRLGTIYAWSSAHGCCLRCLTILVQC